MTKLVKEKFKGRGNSWLKIDINDELSSKIKDIVKEKEEAKNEREAEKDVKLKAKRAEVVRVAKEVGREDISKIEAMGEADLDKEIKELLVGKD
jgi:hypothetical protein